MSRQKTDNSRPPTTIYLWVAEVARLYHIGLPSVPERLSWIKCIYILQEVLQCLQPHAAARKDLEEKISRLEALLAEREGNAAREREVFQEALAAARVDENGHKEAMRFEEFAKKDLEAHVARLEALLAEREANAARERALFQEEMALARSEAGKDRSRLEAQDKRVTELEAELFASVKERDTLKRRLDNCGQEIADGVQKRFKEGRERAIEHHGKFIARMHKELANSLPHIADEGVRIHFQDEMIECIDGMRAALALNFTLPPS